MESMKMKKWSILLLMALTMMVTSGCGLLESVNQGVNFATETTEYMNNLDSFRQEMNGLAEQALTNLDARTDLKNKLLALKDQIMSYKNLEVPDYAKDIHATIIGYNDKLQQGLDQALTNIEQGRAAFESTGLPDTMNKINELLGQLNALNPN
ncbi:hypothetical protein D3P07_08935 [Paenibacillus sp. 1011MAR3C5]|uniref:DUF6376 family protein n=1 Tax=Paenibacillus sp. 1011MAR3C5 TaxID=1675787 RepID=UPI000E6B9786|nr:DUF6376 family protein [Paenibacillus sp. 1011MAR3C5]RJE90317.1 hypothetical protein D3P07_08935 [Paenibacillus sp. 1011MAR3C5]